MSKRKRQDKTAELSEHAIGTKRSRGPVGKVIQQRTELLMQLLGDARQASAPPGLFAELVDECLLACGGVLARRKLLKASDGRPA